MHFKITDDSFFLSQHDLQKVENSDQTQVVDILPQIGRREAEAIGTIMDASRMTVNTVGTTNLIFFYLAGISKQHLWSLMNTMQLIIYSALTNINFPAHAAYFF